MARKLLVPIQLPADPANALEAATKQYVDAKTSSLADSGWLSCNFFTGWSNYGQGQQLCQYRKVGDIVYMRGLALVQAGGSASANWIISLPAGYLPPNNPQIFGMYTNTGVQRIDIQTNGTITAVNASIGGSGWVSFSGVLFSVL